VVREKDYQAVFLGNTRQPKKIAVLTKGKMSIAVGWHFIIAYKDGYRAGLHFFYKPGPVGSKQLRPLREKLHGVQVPVFRGIGLTQKISPIPKYLMIVLADELPVAVPVREFAYRKNSSIPANV